MSQIRITLAFVLLVLLTPAWSAEISLASYSGNAGSSVLAAVSFAAQGALVSGIQLDLEYDSSLMSVVFLIADTGRETQKRIYTSDLGAGKKRTMLIGLNRTPLPDGVLISAFVNLKANAPVGNFPLKLSQVVCSDPDGRPVSVAGVDGSIQVQATSTAAVSIRQDGVLNAASLRPGSIAPGEIITLIGSSIGPASPAVNQGSTIGTTLGGTRLLLNGLAAPLLYASSDQINAVVPYDLSGTTAQLVIEAHRQKHAELTLPVTEVAPAVFTLDSSGSGPGAVLNQDYTVNTPSNPAPRGSVVSLFATGAGQTDPSGTDAQIADRTTLARPVLPVSVQIGGMAVETLYAGTAPGLISNLLQVNVRVPDDITPAYTVPVSIQIGSVRSQAGVTIAVK
jgi:uncharacterized protein (TIGR03437 family)